jgi:pSer/pThr/pTyr-binding forkhead associated (FHA) protein
VVIAAQEGKPSPGTSLPLDAVNSIGRDVNNSIVIDDTFVSSDHALLTFRGRAWYVEDRGSTNGTWLNGQRVEGLLPLGYGDEIQIGQVRCDSSASARRNA